MRLGCEGVEAGFNAAVWPYFSSDEFYFASARTFHFSGRRLEMPPPHNVFRYFFTKQGMGDFVL